MTTKNTSGIHPTEYKVLIKPDKIEEKTKGGIIIPDDAKDKEQAAATAGEIIEVSPLAFSYDEWPDEKAKPHVGQRVAFSRYAGISAKGIDGEDYRLINDKDVAAVYGA